MIFGNSTRSPNGVPKWHKVFAWFPVHLINGQWAWLETVERIDYTAKEIKLDTIQRWGWCYRPIPRDLITEEMNSNRRVGK